ncbi:hypothetical protein [Candidatus Similichlamydia laticola]|uniref:Uncharacterized protein n=1 Tax=Candidatus Similichlamydia laticola TaxID=2170265 RepID=A0A369KFM2_9BACT|nr:hypothetical protein [Candidatus Similichlamydia laticola]RDB31495.1 hypothetical protein HAT2_00369 [Candidatus Similichlamydia laticola]
MFWKNCKSFFFLLLCSSLQLSARPQWLYSGELPKLVSKVQRRGVQLFLISEHSPHIEALTDHELHKLSRDVCVRMVTPLDLENLFSFERGTSGSDIELVCIRFPTHEEEKTGFSSLRITFVSSVGFRHLVQAEGSVMEAMRVLHLIRE